APGPGAHGEPATRARSLTRGTTHRARRPPPAAAVAAGLRSARLAGAATTPGVKDKPEKAANATTRPERCRAAATGSRSRFPAAPDITIDRPLRNKGPDGRLQSAHRSRPGSCVLATRAAPAAPPRVRQ